MMKFDQRLFFYISKYNVRRGQSSIIFFITLLQAMAYEIKETSNQNTQIFHFRKKYVHL